MLIGVWLVINSERSMVMDSLSAGLRHRVGNPHGLHADCRYAKQQVNHFFLVVGKAVGVELLTNGGVLGFLFFVLVQHPFQRAAVAQFAGPGFGRDAVQRGLAIERDGCLILRRAISSWSAEVGLTGFSQVAINDLKACADKILSGGVMRGLMRAA
jgi:hypothetical protein